MHVFSDFFFTKLVALYIDLTQNTTDKFREVIVQWFVGICLGRQDFFLLPPALPTNTTSQMKVIQLMSFIPFPVLLTRHSLPLDDNCYLKLLPNEP